MKATAKFFLIGISLPFCRLLQAQPLELTISPADRAYHLSRLWSEVKYNFVNLDQVKFDADSLYRACLAEAIEAKSDYAYLRLLKRFMAAFNDGHTGFSTNGYESLKLGHSYVPMNIKYINDGLYITSLIKVETITMDTSWLGAKILEIDGIPTEQYLTDSIFPYISASTLHYKQQRCHGLITSNFKNRPLNISIKQRNGIIKHISIPRNMDIPRGTKSIGMLGNHRNVTNPVAFTMLSDSISYLVIQTFAHQSISDRIYSCVHKINASKGVIIDLRFNGGGSTDVAFFLQSLLTPMDSKYFMSYSSAVRVNDGVKKAWSNWKDDCKTYGTYTALRYEPSDTIMISDTLVRIKVPAVVLIGSSTYSAAEDFLISMQEAPKRPIFIGTETGGSTGLPLVVRGFPHGGYAQICTHREYFPYSGKPFVSKGIAPDIVVEETIDDYLHLLGNPFAEWPDDWADIDVLEKLSLERLPRDKVVQAAMGEIAKQTGS